MQAYAHRVLPALFWQLFDMNSPTYRVVSQFRFPGSILVRLPDLLSRLLFDASAISNLLYIL